MDSGRRNSRPSGSAPVELDAVDRRIVDALRADGRLSVRALAQQVHLSRSSAYKRLTRIERMGIIRGYTVRLDPGWYGGETLVGYVLVKIVQHDWRAVLDTVLDMPEVEQASLVYGSCDIVLSIRSRSAAELKDLLVDRLRAIPAVVTADLLTVFADGNRAQPGTAGSEMR